MAEEYPKGGTEPVSRPEAEAPRPGAADPAEPPPPPKLPQFLFIKKSYSQETRLWALASSIGLSLVLAIFMGLALGYWLDQVFNTRPWLLLTGLLLGVAAGFRNLFVIARKVDQKSRELNKKPPTDKDSK